MKHFKKYFQGKLKNFFFYFRYLRYKIFIALILSTFVGILDGLGLSMFIPLLQMIGSSGIIDTNSLGKLKILIEVFLRWGVNLNLFSVLFLMCTFFIMKGVILFLNHSYLVILLQKFIRKMRFDIVRGISRMSFKAFVLSDVGRIQNTASSEIGRISKSYQAYFGTIQQLILVFVYIGFAFLIDSTFAVLVTISGGLTNLVYRGIYKQTKNTSKAVTNDSNVYQGLLVQFIASLKYLKATGLINKYQKRIEKSIIYIEGGNKKIGLLNALLISAKEPLLIIVVIAVIIIQVKLLGSEVGPIILSLLFFYRGLSALITMQNQYNSFLAMSGSMVNMITFLTELERSEEKLTGLVLFKRLFKNIEFKSASFKYEEEFVLRNINLEIRKNETIAIVGESGSGKSTFLNLISGLIPISNGDMVIDEISYKDILKESYQQRIGYITQEPVVFNDTIYNNVTLWEEKTSENISRFNDAINKAAILEFVSELPQKENTLLGNNGINLSGGQKQRISIARELFKDIDILIMDEATAALDSETEKNIQDNIDRLKGKYTIIIVAHRLSTVKNADRILVLRKGKIESVDSYINLIKKSYYFKRMVKYQEL